jgi:heptosyltransferase-3
LKHQYRTENFFKRNLQRFADFFVDLYAKFFIRSDGDREIPAPKNILFVSLAHLGDALIGSYVFPILKERFPDAQIDVLAGEWCKPVLENNSYVRNLIFFNHFRMNRSGISFWEKIQTHLKTSRSALQTIRSAKYDLSIEGRISHPNGNLITYRGKVGRRIGFGSGAFGSLLTDEVPLPSKKNFHILDALLEELKLIDIKKTLDDVKPYFNLSKQSMQINNQIDENVRKPFMILHVETGKDYLPERLINESFWLEIVRIILKDTTLNVIVCGTTKKSTELFNSLQLNLGDANGRIKNLINKLSLDEFFLLNGQAIAAITVDSLAAHFCSINCRTISFYKNGFGALFFPISNERSFVIHNHLHSKSRSVHPNTFSYFVNEVESEQSLSFFYETIKKIV